MRKLLVLLACISISLDAGQNYSGSSPRRYQPGVVIVKLKSPANGFFKSSIENSLFAMQSRFNIASPQRTFSTDHLRKRIGIDELERVFTFRVNEATDIEALAKRMMRDPQVEYAQPNYLLNALDFVPNDSLYSSIYELGIVKASQAWDIQRGDSSVIIAIIDTGVDWDHPDLAAAIWNNKGEIPDNGIDDDNNGYMDDVRGWDFVDATFPGVYPGEDSVTADNNPMDFQGHGTHCAGIAAGVTNNLIGISSLGGGCKIMPLRIGWATSSGGGTGYTNTMSQAFIYAANNGASVASLSFGSDLVAAEGAKYAFKNGVVIVNAAGNENAEDVGGGAAVGAQPWALSVAATNSNDNKASYSSYGKEVDICAPGGDFGSGNGRGFISTIVYPSNLNGNKLYAEFQGTSMATPFVGALAGLIKSEHKDWSPAQIMFQITGTADNIDAKNPSFIGKLGAGRINALRALTETPAAPLPKLEFISAEFNDSVGGNGNNILDPGEQVDLTVHLENQWGDANNVHATISTTDSAITITKTSSDFGFFRGIANIDSSLRANSNDPFKISISPSAVQKIAHLKVTVTADGNYAVQFEFDLSIAPSILVVDDDDGSNNIEGYTTRALETLGTVYDRWDHVKRGTPSASVLKSYPAVIWLCEWAFPALDSADRPAIASYLDGGGKLFISGQDIGWDLADAQGTQFLESSGASKIFYENYLKASYVADDAGYDSLSGILNNPVSSNLKIARYQPGRASDEQYPDVIAPVNGSSSAFNYLGGTYKNQSGAVIYSGTYKLVYFSFGGFESITDSTTRLTVMNNIEGFFGTGPIERANEVANVTPYRFDLAQNYPNPFNPATTVQYSVPAKNMVTLSVYDVLGRKIIDLVNDVKPAGIYQVHFDGSRLSSGIYFYRLSIGSNTASKKMVLMK